MISCHMRRSSAFILLSIWLGLSGCEKDPACKGFNRSETPSPDRKWFLQAYETFCGGPGTAQDNFLIALRKSGKPWEAGTVIFVTEDWPANAQRKGDDRVEVDIAHARWIGLSLHEIDGVKIAYVVDLKKARSELDEQTRRIRKVHPDLASGLTQQYDRAWNMFENWT